MNESKNNDRKLIEETLLACIKEMCCQLQMGLADWEINSTLRRAIRQHPNFGAVAISAKQYDETLDIAKNSGVSFDPKFTALYRLADR